MKAKNLVMIQSNMYIEKKFILKTDTEQNTNLITLCNTLFA